MRISTRNSQLIPVLQLLACIFILLPKNTQATAEIVGRRGAFRRSYVFMEVENKRTGERVKTCVNYQQFNLKGFTSEKYVARDYESAESHQLQFWKDEYNNTQLCPMPDSRQTGEVEYMEHIVPMDYRIRDDGTACTRPFNKDKTSFRNASQFTVTTLQKLKAAGVLLILDKGSQFVSAWKDYLWSEFYDPYIDGSTSIPTFFIYRHILNDVILPIGNTNDSDDQMMEIRFHRPDDPPFDPSMIIIWMIAMICVAGGGFWAHHRQKAGKDVSIVSSSSSQLDNDNASGDNSEPGCLQRNLEKCGNGLAIVFMMICLCGVLLLGYFFRPVLVYFFNIMLVIFGAASIFGCIRALFSNFEFSKHRWYLAKMNWMPTFFGRTEKYAYSGAVIYLLSLAFCITWFIQRREPHGYILLDTINIALCLHVLKCLRLPSLKWITILMVCMFAYDAFMVFGTPAFTKNSCSIMLEVATGIEDCTTKEKTGDSTGYPVPPIEQKPMPDKFPMLMQVPHITPINECIDLDVELSYQVTLLGLGDIVMPGYLIAHVFTMNGVSNNGRLLYGVISLIGYGIGLIVTFIALSLMGIAQPALIYLVPFTLVPIILTAVVRKEFKMIWNGVPAENNILVSQKTSENGGKWVNDENGGEEKEEVDTVVTSSEVVPPPSTSSSSLSAEANPPPANV